MYSIFQIRTLFDFYLLRPTFILVVIKIINFFRIYIGAYHIKKVVYYESEGSKS